MCGLKRAGQEWTSDTGTNLLLSNTSCLMINLRMTRSDQSSHMHVNYRPECPNALCMVSFYSFPSSRQGCDKPPLSFAALLLHTTTIPSSDPSPPGSKYTGAPSIASPHKHNPITALSTARSVRMSNDTGMSASLSSLDQLNLLESPLVRHKITLMRSKNTLPAEFRRLTKELSLLVGVEAARDLRLEEVEEVGHVSILSPVLQLSVDRVEGIAYLSLYGS